MVKRDAEIITGQTVTDENGHFSIPLEDFEGSMEAVIQTRKVEKNEIRTLLFSSTGISRLLRVHTVTESCIRSGATLPTGNRKLKNSTLYI